MTIDYRLTTLRCYDEAAFRRSPPLRMDAAGSATPGAFGPFRVLHQIGAGALGPVFRAYEPDRDRLVAVKVFRLGLPPERVQDRKSTRLNSSHSQISYAVFCLKKK